MKILKDDVFKSVHEVECMSYKGVAIVTAAVSCFSAGNNNNNNNNNNNAAVSCFSAGNNNNSNNNNNNAAVSCFSAGCCCHTARVELHRNLPNSTSAIFAIHTVR